MSSLVFYRKWRPQTFADVVGQEHIVRTLLNALATGRVAHAYLFTGPRGTGKTSTARILAKAVNCLATEGRGEPCNRCASCVSFNEGRSLDLVEMDAASNRGIDEIRDLRERAYYVPAEARRKVYIIDEAHGLTGPAANAFLKLLEEPPAHVIFILATTEPHLVISTIASRCQRFDFRRLGAPAIVQRLRHIAEQEGIAVADRGLELIARSATGSLRDAENILEQLVTIYGPEISEEQVREFLGLGHQVWAMALVRHLVHRDLPGGLRLVQEAVAQGADPRQVHRLTMEGLRSLLLVKVGAATTEELPPQEMEELGSLARGMGLEDMAKLVIAFAKADFRLDPYSPLPLEIAFTEALLSVQETAVPTQAPARASASEPVRSHEAPASARSPRGTEASRAAAPAALAASAAAEVEREAATSATPQPVRPERPSVAPVLSSDQRSPVQALSANWKQLVAAAKKRSPLASGLLNSSCHPEEGAEGEIVLVFKYPLHRDKMVERRENLRAVEEAIEELLGMRYRVRCALASSQESPPARQSVQEAAEGQYVDNPLVQEALRMGLRVIEGDN